MLPGAGRFFYARPTVLHPVLDGLVVALDGATGRTLTAPVELLAKDAPDVARVIAHPGHLLDHLGDTSQGPQLGRVAVRLRAALEGVLDSSELLGRELGLAPRAPCGTKRIGTALFPERTPVRHRLVRDAETAADLGLAQLAGLQHLDGLHPSLLHRREVATGTHSPRRRRRPVGGSSGSGHA